MAIRAAVLLVLALAVTAGGCAAAPDPAASSMANLTVAIDDDLAANPGRICTHGLSFPFDQRVDGRDDPVFADARRNDVVWLEGFTKAGLVVKSRTTAYGPGGAAPIPVDEYVLSADGERYVDDPVMVRAGHGARFCIAETHVGEILVVVPPKEGARERVTTVRYRPALAKLAAWTTTKRAKAAMPWLASWTQHQLAERTVRLHLTADGWEVR